nr:TIGR03761 family integrating conjugative element protein [Pantoea cypripedii]
MNADKEAQNQIPGGLRSSLTIEIHSHYAIRLWEGRSHAQTKIPEGKKIFAVMSMPFLLWRSGIIYRDSLADNPWADDIMFKVEELIKNSNVIIKDHINELEEILQSLPQNVSFSDIVSSSPLNIGVYCDSPLGYQCVWLLVGYDQMTLKAFQAYQYGLINRFKRNELLRKCANQIRKVYSLTHRYRTLKVTRADLFTHTPKALDAIKKMGYPDTEIIIGKKRSSFSPPLKKVNHSIFNPDNG